ncbi:MAG: serine/threonine protein kinase, partial [Planctomycetes bacterium]|nr:serine/threonine protein kinase [Planctomycetota bacterium]
MKTVLITLGLVMFSQVVSAGDWVRFRGPNGSGVSSDSIPTTWDEKTNLQWKTKLPGAGSSSPIVLGERVYVTCFSGAGGRDLKRQLVCVDRSNG